jgi:hypothetical protein
MGDIELILPDGQISSLARATPSTRHSGARDEVANPESIVPPSKWSNGFRARASRAPE